MDALRNISNQSFILPKQGGGSMHLLPGRAVALSAEEMTSSQVQQLLRGGFVQVEKLGKPVEPAAPVAKEEKQSERRKGGH